MAGQHGADDSGTDESLYQGAPKIKQGYHEYFVTNPDDLLDVRVA